jgi:hypothetical protein
MPNPKRKNRKRKRKASSYLNYKRSRKVMMLHYSSLSDIEDSKYSANILLEIGIKAGINAINENKAMNIPLTVIENGWIVKKTADGTVVKIAPFEQEVSNRVNPLTKGTILHVKGNQ